MKQRCLNPRHPGYPDYGGRGITICADWIASFGTFLSHIGPRPSDRHSLDRIDNDGGYEPGNVRWATASQQQRNKRTTKLTEGDVRFIRFWLRRGYSGALLARTFGLGEATVANIKAGRKWAEVV